VKNDRVTTKSSTIRWLDSQVGGTIKNGEACPKSPNKRLRVNGVRGKLGLAHMRRPSRALPSSACSEFPDTITNFQRSTQTAAFNKGSLFVQAGRHRIAGEYIFLSIPHPNL
jgi:hypothetical protein